MAEPDMTEMQDYYERTRRPLLVTPKSRLGKLGCGVALILWFMVLLLPCAFFVLATSGSIRIGHGDIPAPESHPRLEISLIMAPEQRGLQITRSVLTAGTATDQCIETYVSYALWQTDGSAASAVYCDCYERAATDAPWTLASTVYDACGGTP